jgi:thymidylate synthase (FAD)
MQTVEPSVKLLWITPNPAYHIEMGARTCYRSEDKYDPARTCDFIDRVVHQRHHESVVEHASASVQIVCDRGVLAELTRHRLASFSVESTRYCNYGKRGGIRVTPLLDGLTSAQIERREKLYSMIEEVYEQELSEGVAPQQARDNLPTCLTTTIVMTCNFREWLHVIKLRTDKSAHPAIRHIVGMIQKILQRECPEIFGYRADTITAGSITADTITAEKLADPPWVSGSKPVEYVEVDLSDLTAPQSSP